MNDDEILKAEEAKADTEFRELITTYREDIKKLLVLARQDERENLKCEGWSDTDSCGKLSAIWCFKCTALQVREAFEKGKQAKQAEIDTILLKLKKNMELAGYKEGWESVLMNKENNLYRYGQFYLYRHGQFSVFEWIKRKLRK
jgi:hypothetical protein